MNKAFLAFCRGIPGAGNIISIFNCGCRRRNASLIAEILFKRQFWQILGLSAVCFSLTPPASADAGSSAPGGRSLLSGHVPLAVSSQTAPFLGRLPSTQRLKFSIGLPLRDQAGLEAFIAQLNDPANPNYHHYLTVQQFTDLFAPTQTDYQSVVDYAAANGLTVTETPSNRLIVSVEGPVSSVEKAFQVSMGAYQHPTQPRTFYAPGNEPSVPQGLPVLHISGLDNFAPPHTNAVTIPLDQITDSASSSGPGSGPGGTYLGNDFRAAYAPGVSLTGAGQTVGIVSFDDFSLSDIQGYCTQAGLPLNVPIQKVLLDGVTGGGSPGLEITMDIEMVVAMAPGLSQVMVYEGTNPIDVFTRMATDDTAKQLSCSYGVTSDPNFEQIFMELVAQGQNLFFASGDNGAYDAGSYDPDEGDFPPLDSAYIVTVGGTDLTTSGPGGAWQSEVGWVYSGGGPTLLGEPIPSYQQACVNSSNQASATLRNLPDVAAAATNIDIYFEGSNQLSGGTSSSTPLWAGFTALANQEAAQKGNASIGFLNPAIYAIGQNSQYAQSFHDITSGSNPSFDGSPVSYNAVVGYDLVTGWGSPNGQGLIDALNGNSADFTIWASPAVLTLARSATCTTTINLAPQDGFKGGVALSASNLPKGVSASFSPSPATGSSVLTLTASSSAAEGTSTITITGTSGSLKQTVALNLTVTPPADFTLVNGSPSISMSPGTSMYIDVGANPLYGFNGNNVINLSLSGLPKGVTASITPIVPNTTPGIITFTVGSKPALGTANLTVTATYGSISHSMPVVLVVQKVISTASVTTTAGSPWQNTAIATQTGTITVTYDAYVSQAPPIDAEIGLSEGAQTADSGFAILTRFNSSGYIDAIDGGSYKAASKIPYGYTGGASPYHFRLVINLSAHTYSAYVSTPLALSEQTIGTNFAFNTPQKKLAKLDSWGVSSTIGSITVANFGY